MGPSARRRLALAAAFARAAQVYWLAIFPRTRQELARWRKRAAAIPDPVLRKVALDTQRHERGNLEGAAAFAAFVPRQRRAAVVEATIAFQATYDYVDSLVEQPALDPAANGRTLHQALDIALRPGVPHPDYYAHHPHTDDGGYLAELVDACRSALEALPSHAAAQGCARRAVGRMIGYQTLVHAAAAATDTPLDIWARDQTPPDTGLDWWETAAGAASSLIVFALIAAAARASLTSTEIALLEAAYFPWIGTLHVLLDSLVDLADDMLAGHPSLVDHYATPHLAARRMSAIARRARVAVDALPEPAPHALLLTAMTSYYLSSPEALSPSAAPAARHIAGSIGALAVPMLLILRLRRSAARLYGQVPLRR